MPGAVMLGWCADGREDPGGIETELRSEPSRGRERWRRLRSPWVTGFLLGALKFRVGVKQQGG